LDPYGRHGKVQQHYILSHASKQHQFSKISIGPMDPSSSQQPAASSQHSAASTQQPALSSQQSALSTQQPALSTQHSAASTQQPALSSQHSAASTQQPALSTQQPAVLSQQQQQQWVGQMVMSHLTVGSDLS
jgi:hypothetical protein